MNLRRCALVTRMKFNPQSAPTLNLKGAEWLIRLRYYISVTLEVIGAVDGALNFYRSMMNHLLILIALYSL